MKTKTTKKETVKMSAMKKAEQRVKENRNVNLSELSGHNLHLLANAQYKVEQKSIGFVYNTLKRAFYSEENLDFENSVKVLAGSTFPTLSAFKKAYTYKHTSIYGGLGTLKKLNKVFQVKAKIARQNKAVAKK